MRILSVLSTVLVLLIIPSLVSGALMCPLPEDTPQTFPVSISTFTSTVAGQTFGNLMFPCPSIMQTEQLSHYSVDENGTEMSGMGSSLMASGNALFAKEVSVNMVSGLDVQATSAFSVGTMGRGSYNDYFSSSVMGKGNKTFDAGVSGGSGADYTSGMYVSQLNLDQGSSSITANYQAASGTPDLPSVGDFFTGFSFNNRIGTFTPVKEGNVTKNILTAYGQDQYSIATNFYGSHFAAAQYTYTFKP